MIGTEKNCERLYLHKDNENEIYVDNSQNLKQHQIDSLRFLYRQFVKKKNGAVLNFPAGSGKSLVVTLFLNALSSLLKERVLILCVDDEEIDHWKQLFLTWTDYKSDDIAVESSNPRLKKRIFIKKAEDLTSYLRCHWSVVVIKDEHMCKTLQKVVLEADLKIWITSTDVKKDISLLLYIYNWIFPKSNININEIILNQAETENKMVQSIIMDTVLEDFVIRENKLKVIKETKNSEMLKIYKDNNKKGITRKNKDATGNKIKKSKRNIDEEPMEQTNNISDVCNISTEIKEEADILGNGLTNIDIDDNPGIHDEVREEKPEIAGNLIGIEIDDKSHVHAIDVKIDTVPTEDHSFNLLQINQNHTIKTERNTEETLDFQQAVNDIVVRENDIQCVDENSTESLDFGGEENLNSTKSLGLGGEEKNSNAIESLNFGDGVDEKLNSTESLDFGGDKAEIIPDDNDIFKDNSNKFEDKHLDNVSHIKDKENDIKIGLETNSVATEKSELNCNLDFKMSELEESTMKKFKGSLLDSLF